MQTSSSRVWCSMRTRYGLLAFWDWQTPVTTIVSREIIRIDNLRIAASRISQFHQKMRQMYRVAQAVGQGDYPIKMNEAAKGETMKNYRGRECSSVGSLAFFLTCRAPA